MRNQSIQENGRGQVCCPAVPGAAAAILALLLCVCSSKGAPVAGAAGSPSPEGGRAQEMLAAQVAATVGGEPISLKAYERYLADNTGDAGEEDAGQDAAIRSRLLDQLIEEQLLLRASKGLGITVSEAEIDDYLSQIGVSEGEAEVAGGEGKEAFREKVRQGLILQKVKDKAVLSKVEVAPGEVDDYLKKQPEAARVPRGVVLRQILMDDKSLAARIETQLVKDPGQFESLARENSVAPDKGQAREYSEDDLPAEIKDAAFKLEPGQVSPVLEYAGSFLIIRLERKVEATSVDLGELKRRARLELFRKKGEQALDRYIADLKKDTEIHVNRAVLPFEYAGEYQN